MFSFRVRPKIRCVTPMTQDEIYTRFNTFLKETNLPIKGKKFRDHLEIYVDNSEQHYWSPILNITMQNADRGTSVKGRFGPHPKVWTMFMFFYFFAFVFVCFAGLYGVVQLQMSYAPWAFWFFWLGILLFALIYMAAQVGQRKGHAQTEWLLSFCSEVLKHDVKNKVA